jgi:sugar diacid utilization regulator
MIAVGISCLATKDIYFKDISEDVIKLADKAHFPIMIFSNTFTEDVIVYGNKAINEKKEYENLELIIDNILCKNLGDISMRKIALNINIDFKEKNVIAFCKKKSSKLVGAKDFSHKEIEEDFCKVIQYKDGFVLMNTFREAEQKSIEKIMLRRLNWLGFNQKEYVIGVSSLYESLGSLKSSIQESLYAFKYSIIYKKDISFFREIGINKINFSLMDNPWVLKYYNEVIEPLIIYDKANETELLKTAIKYIENNGDVKATAEELFQYGNTVRYRIDKIDKILFENYKSEHFYEELAVCVRIYNLLINPL